VTRGCPNLDLSFLFAALATDSSAWTREFMDSLLNYSKRTAMKYWERRRSAICRPWSNFIKKGTRFYRSMKLVKQHYTWHRDTAIRTLSDIL